MKLHCVHCGRDIHPFSNFCPFCGAEAPKKTVAVGAQPQEIEHGLYCSNCKESNINNAIFCSACGNKIYWRPSGKVLFCPQCCEKNSSQANHCCNCGLFLDDWFAMRGAIAEKLGFTGNLVLKETITGLKYQFFTQKVVSIGRDPHNDIVIPSDWVSLRHCVIDLKKEQLQNLNNTNGTFVNRSPEMIATIPISQIRELNIAGTFTFSVVRPAGLFAIRLTAILEGNDGKIDNRVNGCKKLRSIYFVLVLTDGEILIRKTDGKIVTQREPTHDYCAVNISGDRYYFTDQGHDMENQLILKGYDVLPANWKVVNNSLCQQFTPDS